ncbi:hypothetical protein LF599_04345 [Pseudodesulfovibrio thermohalotolerans]|uniref:hypothetical protein n=1 Tax=Pseudodesulfovibrio thermohalotolerans TaxID=2880651 RepID=UPI0022B9E60F|nr:hypothetical protein [Pseudodesulfovibrio thermohalotolerans]WFS63400.1 hypothetical protein LF599_04345 [Pseudodesulfovibrio thermohalotolerans]
MKKLAAIVIIVFSGCLYLYNTIWFQSMFDDAFYTNIVDIPFNITRKGEKITVPLKFKSTVCYSLAVKVPWREELNWDSEGKGLLKYRFFSGKNLITEGVTLPVSRHAWGGNDIFSWCKLMVFDLPFPHNPKNLTLNVEVIEPFSFLERYNGHTSLIIRPNYEPKIGACYNENLRIPYQQK